MSNDPRNKKHTIEIDTETANLLKAATLVAFDMIGEVMTDPTVGMLLHRNTVVNLQMFAGFMIRDEPNKREQILEYAAKLDEIFSPIIETEDARSLAEEAEIRYNEMKLKLREKYKTQFEEIEKAVEQMGGADMFGGKPPGELH